MNVLTSSSTDSNLLLIWLEDKTLIRQVSYNNIVTKFFLFINRPLSEGERQLLKCL